VVSGQWKEFIIPTISAILTLAWYLKKLNINENDEF